MGQGSLPAPDTWRDSAIPWKSRCGHQTGDGSDAMLESAAATPRGGRRGKDASPARRGGGDRRRAAHPGL